MRPQRDELTHSDAKLFAAFLNVLLDSVAVNVIHGFAVRIYCMHKQGPCSKSRSLKMNGFLHFSSRWIVIWNICVNKKLYLALAPYVSEIFQ